LARYFFNSIGGVKKEFLKKNAKGSPQVFSIGIPGTAETAYRLIDEHFKSEEIANIYIICNLTGDEIAKEKSKTAQLDAKIKKTINFKCVQDLDILEICNITIDLDRSEEKKKIDGKSICASPQEIEEIDKLRAQIITELQAFDLYPNTQVFSGNGYQFTYFFEPQTDTQKTQATIIKILEYLKDKYKDIAEVDTTLSNPSRLTRLAGTRNRKPELMEKVEDGRVYRYSELLETSEKPNLYKNIERLAASIPVPETTPTKPTQARPPETAAPTKGILQTFEEKVTYVRELLAGIYTGEYSLNDGIGFKVPCPFNPEHDHASVTVTQDHAFKFKCFHDSCQGRTWEEYRNAIGRPKEYSPVVGVTCNKCNTPDLLWGQDKNGKFFLVTRDGVKHQCQGTPIQTSQKIENVEVEEIETIEEKKEVLLNLDELHPFFQRYWNRIEGTSEACKEYVLSGLLTVIGSLLGNRVELQNGFGIKPNLYCLLIGDSTFMRKTTSLDCATAELDIISREKGELFAKEYKQYLEELDTWKKGEKRPEKPKSRENLYPQDITPEALLARMAGRPDGLFVFSEMGAFLAKLDTGYMTGFKEKLTEFYDGRNKDYIKETKSGGLVTVKNPCPSLLGCSTFQWLQEHLKESDLGSGFLARFLYVVKRKYPDKGIAIPSYFQHDDLSIYRMLDQYSNTLRMNTEASKLYQAWYDEKRTWAIKQEKNVHSFLGRILTTCHKIAIIHHAIDDCLTGQRTNEIGILSYQYAFAWCEFFINNILNCYQELTQEVDYKELKLVECIRKRGKKEGEYIALSVSETCKFTHLKKKELDEIVENLITKKQMVYKQKGQYKNLLLKV
jgi:hypothetical protein